MSMEKALTIGIDTITNIQKITELIKKAETKDEILYILKRMEEELIKGRIEIDKITISTL